MKKSIFGIAATMLLVGTMALTSCSDDCVFGYDYDEEWDDLVPRTKWTISTDPSTFEKKYVKIRDGECSVVALALSRGVLEYDSNSNMIIEEEEYYDIIALLQQQDFCSMIDYENDLKDGSISRTDNQWKSIFGCDEVVDHDDFNFGTTKMNRLNWYGQRELLGKPHIDYIIKYIPEKNDKPAQFVTGSWDRVDVSEYNVIYK